MKVTNKMLFAKTFDRLAVLETAFRKLSSFYFDDIYELAYMSNQLDRAIFSYLEQAITESETEEELNEEIKSMDEREHALFRNSLRMIMGLDNAIIEEAEPVIIKPCLMYEVEVLKEMCTD